jgi:hypothetical protein
MTKYEEAYARCSNCTKFEKCAEALCDFIWRTHIPTPKVINCEYFPELGEAIKEYVKVRIHETLIKSMEENN